VLTWRELEMLFSGQAVKVEEKHPLPGTARFYTASFDILRNEFVCIFEDQSFDDVRQGCEIPIADSFLLDIDPEIGLSD